MAQVLFPSPPVPTLSATDAADSNVTNGITAGTGAIPATVGWNSNGSGFLEVQPNFTTLTSGMPPLPAFIELWNSVGDGAGPHVIAQSDSAVPANRYAVARNGFLDATEVTSPSDAHLEIGNGGNFVFLPLAGVWHVHHQLRLTGMPASNTVYAHIELSGNPGVDPWISQGSCAIQPSQFANSVSVIIPVPPTSMLAGGALS